MGETSGKAAIIDHDVDILLEKFMRAKIIIYTVKLLARTPFPVIQMLGTLFGWLSYLLPNEERRIARINIDLCFPELSLAERRLLLRQSLIENARTLLEMPAMWTGDPQRWLDKVEVGEGGELLQQTLAQGKGLIAAGPHLGNWELGLHFLTTLSKVTALYRPPKEEGLEELIKSGRSSAGATLVPATAKGVRAIFSALRNGELMGVLCDQEPKAAGKQGGVFAPFLGHQALSMVLVNRMAEKTGAPVLFWYMERLQGGKKYRIHWFAAPGGIADPDPVIGATAMNEALERCIRRCPSQYLWSYKRFRAQPEGAGRRNPYSRR